MGGFSRVYSLGYLMRLSYDDRSTLLQLFLIESLRITFSVNSFMYEIFISFNWMFLRSFYFLFFKCILCLLVFLQIV